MTILHYPPAIALVGAAAALVWLLIPAGPTAAAPETVPLQAAARAVAADAAVASSVTIVRHPYLQRVGARSAAGAN